MGGMGGGMGVGPAPMSFTGGPMTNEAASAEAGADASAAGAANPWDNVDPAYYQQYWSKSTVNM